MSQECGAPIVKGEEEEEASLSSLESMMVEPSIPNQGPAGNPHSAIILIRLGLIA